jgi:hypothetical protein
MKSFPLARCAGFSGPLSFVLRKERGGKKRALTARDGGNADFAGAKICPANRDASTCSYHVLRTWGFVTQNGKQQHHSLMHYKHLFN